MLSTFFRRTIAEYPRETQMRLIQATLAAPKVMRSIVQSNVQRTEEMGLLLNLLDLNTVEIDPENLKDSTFVKSCFYMLKQSPTITTACETLQNEEGAASSPVLKRK